MIKQLKGKLYHPISNFDRTAYEKIRLDFGFNNIVRIELFLWDLELFQQIQHLLKDRIVLKGGAAVQFYLPENAQRNSVDIDMIFYGTEDDIENALAIITNKLGINDLFVFERHQPRKAKTKLNLYTYFVKVPSLLTEKELQKESTYQEIKIEFFTGSEPVEVLKVRGNKMFDACGDLEYNILPLNILFADKLTTLGPETIGVQNDRMDEQIKHLYDIWMLLSYNLDKMDLRIIKHKFFKRAELECVSRGIPFNCDIIKTDILEQLKRLSEVDGGQDKELKKYINDFKSVYLNSNIGFRLSEVACAARQIKLVYDSIFNKLDNFRILEKYFIVANKLELSQYTGVEKGEKTKEIKSMLIKKHGHLSSISPVILKGKNLIRVFWSVAEMNNINEIEETVSEFLANK